jgi:hypothetical protein
MAAKVYATADPAHPFAPLKKPVLHRMQEVQGSSKGSVFVWVEPSGRPAAICDVFLYAEGPGRYSLNNAWHSLSASPPRSVRRFRGTRSGEPRETRRVSYVRGLGLVIVATEERALPAVYRWAMWWGTQGALTRADRTMIES